MITLASDFGSPYPAAMRGVIARRCDASVIDVAHDFPRQDVRAAAFWLGEVLPYVPPAVHCAVVDPGVGTDRDAIVLRAGRHLVVAPDNGLADPVARRLAGPTPTAGAGLRGVDPAAAREAGSAVDGDGSAADAPTVDAYRVLVDAPESATFHGRDVFAPVAAELHRREAFGGPEGSPTDGATGGRSDPLAAVPFLEAVETIERLRFPEPELSSEGAIGEVLVVDGFGNVITNVPGGVLDGRESVRVDDRPVPVGRSFATVPEGQWLATVGSHGNVELAVNRGSGAAAFGLESGDPVVIEYVR